MDKRFTIGQEDYPEWFRDMAKKGRAQINVDEDGKLESITVYTPTKTYVALPGDVIILAKAGVTVMSAKQAAVLKEGGKKNV